jgi:hypothetical protein
MKQKLKNKNKIHKNISLFINIIFTILLTLKIILVLIVEDKYITINKTSYIISLIAFVAIVIENITYVRKQTNS